MIILESLGNHKQASKSSKPVDDEKSQQIRYMIIAGQNPPGAVETGKASIPAPIAVPAIRREAVRILNLEVFVFMSIQQKFFNKDISYDFSRNTFKRNTQIDILISKALL